MVAKLVARVLQVECAPSQQVPWQWPRIPGRVSDSAGPVGDSLHNAAHRVAFPLVQQGRHPGTVISELNTWPTLPLAMLRIQPHDCIRMTRGHDGAATPFM